MLLALALGLGGLVLAAVISGEPAVDFSATWRLQPDDSLSLEVLEEDGLFAVSFTSPDGGWRREAVMRQVDRFQLAGRLGAVEGVTSGAARSAIVETPSGAWVSVLSVSEDTVDVGVREAGAVTWTDLGTFKRGAIWSDPSRAAGWIMTTLLVAMVAALVLQIPLVRTHRARHDTTVRRVVTALAVMVLLVALLAGSSILALVSVLVLFATWLLKLVRWLPEEVTGTGAMLDYLLSPKRRDAYHEDAAERDAQAERGVALEQALGDVRHEWSGTARAPVSQRDPT